MADNKSSIVGTIGAVVGLILSIAVFIWLIALDAACFRAIGNLF